MRHLLRRSRITGRQLALASSQRAADTARMQKLQEASHLPPLLQRGLQLHDRWRFHSGAMNGRRGPGLSGRCRISGTGCRGTTASPCATPDDCSAFPRGAAARGRTVSRYAACCFSFGHGTSDRNHRNAHCASCSIARAALACKRSAPALAISRSSSARRRRRCCDGARAPAPRGKSAATGCQSKRTHRRPRGHARAERYSGTGEASVGR